MADETKLNVAIDKRIDLADLKVTLADVWKLGATIVPIAGLMIAFWLNVNTTMANHAASLKTLTDKSDAQAQQITTLSERVSKIDEDQLKIMFQLRIPFDSVHQLHIDPMPAPASVTPKGHSKVIDPFLVTETQQQDAGEFPGLLRNRPVQ